jgi:squalene-hopene/tetraprenyl-beta-curcumene cyclase
MQAQVLEAYQNARAALLAARNEHGWWEGKLSSSALSTATAVIALLGVDAEKHRALAARGLAWLAETQCADGGWGDTTLSKANLSTTLLCRAAFGIGGGFAETVQRAEAWITARTGSMEPAKLSAALEKRYGRDKTFSVPILMALALGGVLGSSPQCWKYVPQLPFELAALPRGLYAAVKMPVVSYALPALIAIGQVRFHFVRGNPVAAVWRKAAVERTLKLLREIQPDGGGFLEATPLTSFVTMAMAAMGRSNDPVVQNGESFLLRSVRGDGSWPIDTNLATWVTTLSCKALGDTSPEVRDWLLDQQYQSVHLYTLSPPGGWAWTDLPGGVPDADDTSGALLSLRDQAPPKAALAAARWLLGLQNSDGGIPTFCRGWGTLPFDRSTPEITAHAAAALFAWKELPEPRVAAALPRMKRYLEKTQHADGWWEPLWFGNEHAPVESNPVYGTAAVLKHLCSLPGTESMRVRAAAYLVRAQRADGSWSGAPGDLPPGIEETGAALEALTLHGADRIVLERGAEALLRLTQNGTHFPAAPIGLYFARLWYHEQLYPLIATVSALRVLCAGNYFASDIRMVI